MHRIAVNTRVLTAPLTGVRRYTEELLSRWKEKAETIGPRSGLHGLSGHAWEQLILPMKLGERVLFSPANTGPLLTSRQVVTIHDMATFDCEQAFSGPFAAWYRYLLPRIAHQATQVITISEFIKHRIVKHTGISPNKITVIANGVGERFCPDAVSGLNEARTVLRLPSYSYILVIGSADPRKNVARLIQAWSSIQDRMPRDLWMVVIGVTRHSRVFAGIELGNVPENVLFADHVDDRLLPGLYAGALGVAYVSVYEGFGLPALEAMSSGTPVLVSNCSSLPEVVGDAALFVDPFDVDEIGKAILRLVEDSTLRTRLRDAGLQRAKQFSWDVTAQKTWDVLQKTASMN